MSSNFQSLRESLLQLGALGADLAGFAPTISQTALARDKVTERFGLPDVPSAEQQEALFQRFKAWLERQGPALADDDWNLAPFVYFRGDPKLCTYAAFADGVALRMAAETQPRILRRAIYAYLRDFDPTQPVFAALGQSITTQLARSQTRWASDWQARASVPRRLFAPDRLADRLADEICARAVAPRALLRDLGLSTELAVHCGLHRPLARALLLQFERASSAKREFAPTTLQEIIDFQRTGDTLRFPDLKVPIAECLLRPFAVRAGAAWTDPSEPVRAILSDFFERPFFGAPRNLPDNWAGVPSELQAVVSRWLVRRSLETFFDVLSRTADPIWRYRRAFWLALYRHGLIEDAWPAFGNRARGFIESTGRSSIAASSKLHGGLNQQSVMIMKMRSFVVAEWSHSGACRIWADGDARAPKIGTADYWATDLREDCLFAQNHTNAMGGSWQISLSNWIAQRTGVRVALHELMAGTHA